MLRRVVSFLKKNSAVFALLTVFNDLLTPLEANLTEIDLLKEQQSADITGLRKKKESLRITAYQKAMEICNALQVFAKISGDVVLADEIKYTETDLRKCSDNELDSNLGVIYSAALRNKDELIAYGITEEKLTGYKAAIDNYKAAIGTPKSGTIERKQITDRLAYLFDAEMVILEKIDLLVETFKFSNPSFYAEYHDNRKVNYYPTYLMVNSTITDAATGLGLLGVKISFALNGVTVLEKLTGDGGGIKIKSIEAGIYAIGLTKTGYIAQTLTVNITGDDLVTITAAMVKES